MRPRIGLPIRWAASTDAVRAALTTGLGRLAKPVRKNLASSEKGSGPPHPLPVDQLHAVNDGRCRSRPGGDLKGAICDDLRQSGEQIHVIEDRVQATAEPGASIHDGLRAVEPECRQIEACGMEVVQDAVGVRAERFRGIGFAFVEVGAQPAKAGVGHGKGLLRGGCYTSVSGRGAGELQHTSLVSNGQQEITWCKPPGPRRRRTLNLRWRTVADAG